MRWYIVMMGSEDYYMCAVGFELVQAANAKQAEELAKQTRIDREQWYQGKWPHHMRILEIFECGKHKPVIQ